MLRRTPLFTAHQKLGGKLIEFGGWEMPVHYTSITDEHLAVRNAAGVFDISHMGEVTVSGAASAEFLNHVLTNDIRKLTPGLGQYTLMCNERGGVIDDLYAYCLSGGVYFLIINASRIEADVAWLQARAAEFAGRGELRLTDASHNYAAVAVQGPRVKEFIEDCIPGPSVSALRVSRVTDLQKNEIGGFPFEKGCALVSRTGYTGEDGFEIVAGDEAILRVWDAVLAKGQAFGLKPCGLGARDTLRTEVCYPLYGHELNEDTTPIEAGVGFFVTLDKGEFLGSSVPAGQKANGVKKKCIAFKMTEKSAPPRPGYAIWAGGVKIGDVVSGTQSPSLGIGIGMGYVPPELAKAGTPMEIEIRGKRLAAVVVAKPIYRKRRIFDGPEKARPAQKVFPFRAGCAFCCRQIMSNIPPDLKYARSHEWVRVSGDTAVVGITDHAQHELTDVVFVELPEVGRQVKAGEACAVVESVKTASDIYSPVSGEIVEANKPVTDNPALVNTEPYTAGWFYKVKLSNAAELDALLKPEDYKAQIGG